METALRLSGGTVTLDFVDLPDDDPHRERTYSEHLACLDDGSVFRRTRTAIFLVQLTIRRLPDLFGFGYADGGRPNWSFPTPAGHLSEGAIQPWSYPSMAGYYQRLLGALAESLDFDIDAVGGPPKKIQDTILNGRGIRSQSSIGIATVATVRTRRGMRASWRSFSAVTWKPTLT